MNIYSSPEKFGLTLFGEVDFDGGYEFDKVVVWRDAKGRWLYARDRGCSCPVPFDGVGISGLTRGTRHQVIVAIAQRAKEREADYGDTAAVGATLDLISRIRSAPSLS